MGLKVLAWKTEEVSSERTVHHGREGRSGKKDQEDFINTNN